MSFYWTEVGGADIRILAAPFGLGPRVAANTLAEQMRWKAADWKRATFGPTVERCSLLLNFGVVDPRSYGGADFKVWIDPLLWLRSVLPSVALEYDVLLAEAFFESNSLAHAIHGSLVDVQPLFDSIGDRNSMRESQRVLISFGGIFTPYNTSTHSCHAPAAFIRAIGRAANRSHATEVICCLPSALVTEIACEVADESIVYVSPTRAEFLGLLRSAETLVVNPGLYGPFEAFESGTRVMMAPPISYTQFGQAMEFRRREIAGPIALLDEICAVAGALEFTFGDEQEEFARRVDAWWKKAGHSPETVAALDGWADAVVSGDTVDLVSARRSAALAARSYPAAYEVLSEILSGRTR